MGGFLQKLDGIPPEYLFSILAAFVVISFVLEFLCKRNGRKAKIRPQQRSSAKVPLVKPGERFCSPPGASG